MAIRSSAKHARGTRARRASSSRLRAPSHSLRPSGRTGLRGSVIGYFEVSWRASQAFDGEHTHFGV
eukprot:4678890-Alexandrium_andersonii.AAC.1